MSGAWRSRVIGGTRLLVSASVQCRRLLTVPWIAARFAFRHHAPDAVSWSRPRADFGSGRRCTAPGACRSLLAVTAARPESARAQAPTRLPVATKPYQPGSGEAAGVAGRSELRGVPQGISPPSRNGRGLRPAGAHRGAARLLLGSRFRQRLRSEESRRREPRCGGPISSAAPAAAGKRSSPSPTSRAHPRLRPRPACVCAPARPDFDSDDFDQTDRRDAQQSVGMGLSRAANGLEVRAAPRTESAVVEKLGQYFVRVVRFETTPANAEPIRTAWARDRGAERQDRLCRAPTR